METTSRQQHRAPTSKSHNPVVRAFDWMFRDRETGKVVIMQVPNLPLFLFIFAAAVRRFAHPHGTVGTIVSVIAAVSLLWWAADEVLRGVNPFRRILGALVGIATIVGLFLR
jgi:hypothetical protein